MRQNKNQNKQTKQTKRREKFNFKPWLITVGVIALIFGVFSLIYFIQNHRTVLKFTYENGEYYDKKNDITYVPAPMCYSFCLKSGEEYAVSDRLTFYYVGYKDADDKVHMCDPTAWLTTSFEEGAVIYYNPEKVSLPETKDFGWEEIYLCNTGGTLFATQELDPMVTARLLNAYFEAPEEENLFESRFDMEYLKEVRVTSYRYPWLHMIMRLYTDGMGSYYLASFYDSKMVKTDSEVFIPFFEDQEKQNGNN